MNNEKINVLIKAWETYQNLSKGFGENSWKIRVTGIGFWSAITTYGYKNDDSDVFLFSLIIVTLFFLLESGMRLLQYKYIDKSIKIEKSINDYLVGDEIQLPNDGISTNVIMPSAKDFLSLFKLKRWMFWVPYGVLLTATILFMIGYL